MDDIDAAIIAWTTTLDKDEVFALLRSADIPAALVRSVPAVLCDPALRD